MIEKQTKQFYLLIGVVLLIIIGIILIPKFFTEEVKTINDLHMDNLEGKLNDDVGYVYNGASFIFVDGLWYSQVRNIFNGNFYNVPMHYGPRELEDVSVEGDLSSFLELAANNTISDNPFQVYLTFDPRIEELQYIALADGELTQNLVKTFNLGFLPACTTDEVSACVGIDIITCNNTENPVIFFDNAEPTLVKVEDNCLIIQGDGMEVVRAADRLLLQLYNIME